MFRWNGNHRTTRVVRETIMKFIMVIIICFGADCEAIYDVPKYDDYNQCYKEAIVTAN